MVLLASKARAVLITAIFLTAVGHFSAAAEPCAVSLRVATLRARNEARRAEQASRVNLNPAEVLLSKGLNPDLISIKVSPDSSQIPTQVKLEVLYDGQSALKMTFTKLPGEDHRFSTHTHSPGSYHGDQEYFFGKGIGWVAYLCGAKIMHDRWGATIVSDLFSPSERTWGVSESARKIWGRMAIVDLAGVKMEANLFSRFYSKNESLGSNRLMLVADFIATHVLEESVTE